MTTSQEDTRQRRRNLRSGYYQDRNKQETENRRAVSAFIKENPDIVGFWKLEDLAFCYDALKLLDSVRWKEDNLGPESKKRVRRAKDIILKYPWTNDNKVRETFLGREPFILVIVRHLRSVARKKALRGESRGN